MQQTIGIWGNNHAVRIPKDLDIFQTGEKVEVSQMSDGSIRITPAARQHDMGDLLGELRELKWHYMELIEATPTREIDPEPIRARAKISAYSDIAAVLDELLKKYGG